MIPRRPLLAGLASLPLAARAATPPPGNRLAFRVSRNGTPVGNHVLEFAPQPDGFDIRIVVDIVVKLGPVALFRYGLRGLEQWRGGSLTAAESKTDNNGIADFMRLRRAAEGLRVEGSASPSYIAPPRALLATHWNQAQLEGPWINPQDGRLMRPAVARLGAQPLTLADGRRITAERFGLSGEVTMDLWYSEARQWSALRAPGKDGSAITYDLT